MPHRGTFFSESFSGQENNSVLIISGEEGDFGHLREILGPCGCSVQYSRTFADAKNKLARFPGRIVMTEHDLPDASWRDIHRFLETSPDPPLLLVSSTKADEQLWAEVLSVGGYDVLLKPFNATEVTRVME